MGATGKGEHVVGKIKECEVCLFMKENKATFFENRKEASDVLDVKKQCMAEKRQELTNCWVRVQDDMRKARDLYANKSTEEEKNIHKEIDDKIFWLYDATWPNDELTLECLQQRISYCEKLGQVTPGEYVKYIY